MWMCGTIRQANPDTTPRHAQHVSDTTLRHARHVSDTDRGTKKCSALFLAPLQSWAVVAPVLFQCKKNTLELASEYNRYTTGMPSVAARYAKSMLTFRDQVALPVPR